MNIEWKKITSDDDFEGEKFAKYFPQIFTPFHVAKIGIKLNSTFCGKRLKRSFHAKHIQRMSMSRCFVFCNDAGVTEFETILGLDWFGGNQSELACDSFDAK